MPRHTNYRLGLVKDAGLSSFGESWAERANFASLIFDYRRFGGSGGEPRNLVVLGDQLQDYKSVIAWARTKRGLFKTEKIAVMGSAASGLHVADLVVNDKELAGGMAHCPLLDGTHIPSPFLQILIRSHSGKNTLLALPANPRLMFWSIIDTIKGFLGLSPIFIRMGGKPGEFAFLNTPSTFPGLAFAVSTDIFMVHSFRSAVYI